jgi:hypothetical protein
MGSGGGGRKREGDQQSAGAQQERNPCIPEDSNVCCEELTALRVMPQSVAGVGFRVNVTNAAYVTVFFEHAVSPTSSYISDTCLVSSTGPSDALGIHNETERS